MCVNASCSEVCTLANKNVRWLGGLVGGAHGDIESLNYDANNADYSNPDGFFRVLQDRLG